MTKHIRVRASGSTDDSAELASFTPAFLWLLRDFYLRLEEDGRQVGGGVGAGAGGQLGHAGRAALSGRGTSAGPALR